MKANLKKFFDNEFILLEDYKEKAGIKSPLTQMRQDKIKGSIKLAQYLELITIQEVQDLYHRLLK